jgi:hypothetical protein
MAQKPQYIQISALSLHLLVVELEQALVSPLEQALVSSLMAPMLTQMIWGLVY